MMRVCGWGVVRPLLSTGKLGGEAPAVVVPVGTTEVRVMVLAETLTLSI